MENRVPESESASLDGGLCLGQTVLGDGDLDDSTNEVVAVQVHRAGMAAAAWSQKWSRTWTHRGHRVLEVAEVAVKKRTKSQSKMGKAGPQPEPGTSTWCLV